MQFTPRPRAVRVLRDPRLVGRRCARRGRGRGAVRRQRLPGAGVPHRVRRTARRGVQPAVVRGPPRRRATECSSHPSPPCVGIGVTGIVSALVASWAFDRLLVGLPGRRMASWWFGVGTLVNLLIGRLTFAIGLALGLCAPARRCAVATTRSALALASATMLGSPVAGAFLALAIAAWTLNDVPDRLWRGVGLGVACFGPYVVLMRLFPSGGWFPYHAQSFLIGVGISVLLLVFVPEAAPRDPHRGGAPHRRRRRRDGRADADGREHQPADDVLRRADPRRRHPGRPPQAAVAASPCRCCTGSGARRSTPSSTRRPTRPARPSTTRHSSPRSTTSYADHGPVRVEIVPTLRHWEVAEVAPEIPIARGWWRQLDMEYNPLFYDGTLDAATLSRVAPPRGGVVRRASPTASSTTPASTRRR